MTKWISLLVVVALLYGGWQLFLYYDRMNSADEAAKKKAEVQALAPEQLPGVPSQLEAGLQEAKNQGATALKNWLKAYGKSIQDPRKAWIELDYCLLVSRENPAEARRVFAEVKNRTPDSSPVWPRIKQLDRTYE